MKKLSDSKSFELIAVIGTICAFSFCVGFIYPVIALALEARGYDEAAIGLSATATGIGVFAGGLMIPRLVKLYGTFSLLAGSALLAVLSLLLFPLTANFALWLVLRFFLGVAVTALFSAGEAWINAIADDDSRGRTVAIYVAAMASSFATGSLAVTAVGYHGFVPYAIASVVILVCFIPVLPFHKRDPLAETEILGEHKNIVLTVLREAIILMVVVGLFGILDGVMLGLLPSYGLSKGLVDADASLPLAAMAVGVVLFQFPLGYLSDRMSRARLLTIILFIVVAFALLVPELDLTQWHGLVLMALFGGLSFAPYTLALSMLGERYRGQKLAAGSALFAIMWGIGGTLGPMGFGVAMQEFGSNALPYGLALLFVLTAFISLFDRTVVPVRANKGS
ncbi:MAG: MFS transporter [Alphaproteobacteria bacterium]|nr:MFS transporter [Alphaproteobacteria bacterium]